jgi:hypothetical protein
VYIDDRNLGTQIDITFDFRSDTPPGKDPDALSPTLRSYHKRLWSKRLPSGPMFELDDASPHYLRHQSQLGEFSLSSDSVIPTFCSYRSVAQIIDQIPSDERDDFKRLSYTIGGMMLFPANRIEGKATINGARGFNHKIKDRFDLTVECIRRHYCDEDNPLNETLSRYSDFFALFVDFPGYVRHFLLEDLVTDDYSAVRFFLPFDNFKTSPLPQTLRDYVAYRQRAIDFILARNHRISQTC